MSENKSSSQLVSIKGETNQDFFTNKKVYVETTGRLHMGFFDLNGGLGRKFGSIGLSLNAPELRISASCQKALAVSGPDFISEEKIARVEKVARQFLQAMHIDVGANIWVDACLDTHAGLGSGTQIALAVGTALAKLYDLPLTTQEIALKLGRGGRSGIGIAAFDVGGVLVDGGRSSTSALPPILARYDFPADWRILLIFDQNTSGVHGAQELQAFKTLPIFPENLAAHLCRSVLMQAMPALVERDLNAFGQAILQLQEATGDYFAPAQGGRYASKIVTKVLEHLASLGVACYGQSSWGPTGFAVFENEQIAYQHLTSLEEQFACENLVFTVTSARNHGANIKVRLDEAVSNS
jgi:beta-RFAP synthase